MSRFSRQPAQSDVSAQPDLSLPQDLRQLAIALGYQVGFRTMAEPVAQSTAMAVIQTHSASFSKDKWRVLRHTWFVECKTLIAESAYEHDLDFRVEVEDARKSVGPCLSRGGNKDQATAIATKYAPHLHADYIALIVDEEAAWWVRYRYERGFSHSSEMAA